MKNVLIIISVLLSFGSSLVALSNEVPLIKTNTKRLRAYFWDGTIKYKTEAATSDAAIAEFIRVRYGEAFSIKFEFVKNFDQEIQERMPIAGTLTRKQAISELIKGADYLTRWSSDPQKEKVKKDISAIYEELAKASADFGFEAYYQNSCGDPAPYFFIFDHLEGMLYGFDLRPCLD